MGTFDNAFGAKYRSLGIRVRYEARRALNRIDNEQVRRARHLLTALRKAPPDVILFGDSVLSFVGDHDTDRRRLSAMVSDGFGSDVSVRVVDGPSFNSDIYDAYLKLLVAAPRRPLVLIPLCVRVHSICLRDHPVHGHKRAIHALRELDPSKSAWRVRGSWPKPTQSDFEAFHREHYPTLLGDLTVGDYLSSIAQAKRSGDEPERLKMLYAYLHGGLLTPNNPALESVTRMARTIRELGCPVVVYQTPAPVETGTRLLGPDLAERTIASLAALNAAYRLGAGTNVNIVESGAAFSESEFIDPSDATEHLNEQGRHRLAEMILTAAKQSPGFDQ